MKKYSAALVIMMCLAVTIAFSAKPRKVIGPGEGASHFREAYHQPAGTTVTLSRDTVYMLTGWYFVDSTATINIQSGTLILGDTTSAATLIVKRGAQIFAAGTAQAPIVFTSSKAVGRRAPGDWGGVIILGQAPTNQSTNQQIEGGFGTIPNSYSGYGGTVDADNSGIFQYVRIEFAGIVFQANNESNGLTLGGVGSGTTIDHIQVSFGNDDDFEFFGGTVRAKYLVGWRHVDDCFDTDFGFSGSLQFLYTKRDPNILDVTSAASNGPESDNTGTPPYLAWPKTKARLSNWTLVGPASDTNTVLNVNWGRLGMIRRNSALSIYNSIMIGWQSGILLNDSLTHVNASNDTLQLSHLSIASKYPGIAKSSQTSALNVQSWWETAGKANIGFAGRQQSAIGLPAAVFNLDNSNNPVPPSGTEPATAGTAYDGRLAGDAFFDNVSYRGAFVPGQPMSAQWTASWTNFEPEKTHYAELSSGWNLVSVPLVISDYDPTHVYPGKVGDVFKYNTTTKNYDPETVALTNGTGYWVNYSVANTVPLSGSALTAQIVTATQAGWVLVGSQETTIPVASLVLSNGATINGDAWVYNPATKAYDPTTIITAGSAVWINVSAACTITIP